jgi:hypothetical protein
MGTTGTTWLVISASVVAARTTISIASSAIARWTVTACGTITSVTAITSIAAVTAIATIFLGELLGHRFKWLVVSDESNLFNFVNFDATLGDADDRDAINVEFCFGFDNISGL